MRYHERIERMKHKNNKGRERERERERKRLDRKEHITLLKLRMKVNFIVYFAPALALTFTGYCLSYYRRPTQISILHQTPV